MDEINRLLTRGVEKIFPSRDALEKVLRGGKKLRLYQGFDPTGTKLHIGHAVAIRKLRQFQNLGHEVIFLVGDGTGQAGDPSGKKTARDKFFTTQELRANAEDYLRQAGKIVSFEGFNPVKILYNGDWLNKLGLTEVLNIAGKFSLQQMLERDLYQERLKSGVSLSLREFLYPLLQGYDSVAMKVDLELGGTDQTFNMLAGRHLVRLMQRREKFVMTVPLLTDAKGNKIGKSEGNVIGMTDSANDFYDKIMSLGDLAIIPCFTLLTDLEDNQITSIETAIQNGENPMIYKKLLAYTLTKMLNCEDDAQKAQEHFEKTFQKKELTGDIPTHKINVLKNITVKNMLLNLEASDSASDIKRLISSGAVEIDGVKMTDPQQSIKPRYGMIVKVGKHRFYKIN